MNVRLAQVADVPVVAAILDRDFVRLDRQRDLAGIRTYCERLEYRGEKEDARFAWALYERPVRR